MRRSLGVATALQEIQEHDFGFAEAFLVVVHPGEIAHGVQRVLVVFAELYSPALYGFKKTRFGFVVPPHPVIDEPETAECPESFRMVVTKHQSPLCNNVE